VGNRRVQKTRTANQGSGYKEQDPIKKILKKAMANYLSVSAKKTTVIRKRVIDGRDSRQGSMEKDSRDS